MAGQRIDREARATQTGMTPIQRDRYIWEQRHRGVSYGTLSKQLGMSKSAIKYTFDRLSGKPRQQRQSAMCEGCWRDLYRDELTNGLCAVCLEADA